MTDDPMTTLSLAEWFIEETQRLSRFRFYWLREHRIDPEKFPDAMEEADWYEAFLTFDE
jgi:hypothetical protein